MSARLKNHVSSMISLWIIVGVSQLQAGEPKKVLTMDDCGLWRTVSSTELSSDGKWMLTQEHFMLSGSSWASEKIPLVPVVTRSFEILSKLVVTI